MRLRLATFMIGVGLMWGLDSLPASAQITDRQVGALVEALRQAAPQTGTDNDGLYSQWQVKPENIPRWSRSCIGREITPEQFDGSPVTARSILTCVMRDVLQDEYGDSSNNETLAVRRAAAWWMTGDPTQYDRGTTADYTQQVLRLYQQQAASAIAPASRVQSSAYDRYMEAAYTATQQRDYETALLYFRRALDERPNDSYAIQAIRNIGSYRQEDSEEASSSEQAQPSPNSTSNPQAESNSPQATASLNQEQAIALIDQWLQAKQQIFAPPFNQQLAETLTTGELYNTLVSTEGVMSWLQDHQAYYRFGVQTIESVQRFAANGNRATIEVEVTEDRTLYQEGNVNLGHTNFETERVRYTLEAVDGDWKIADYKTVGGSLLERAVLSE